MPRNNASIYRNNIRLAQFAARAVRQMGGASFATKLATGGARAIRNYYGGGESSGRGADKAALHSTSNERVTYSKRRTNKKKARRARKKINRFKWQLSTTQPGLQAVQHFNTESTPPNIGDQNVIGIDFMSGTAVRNYITDQADPATSKDMRDFEIYIKSASMDVQLVNQSGTESIMCYVYVIAPRRDVASADSSGNVTDDFKAWQGFNGVPGTDSRADPDGDTVPQANYVGVQPFINQRFTRTFMIRKIRKIYIPAGGYVALNMTLDKPVWVNGDRANTAVYLRGISKHYMIRHFGLTNTGPTHPQTKLNITYQLNVTNKVTRIRTANQAISS